MDILFDNYLMSDDDYKRFAATTIERFRLGHSGNAEMHYAPVTFMDENLKAIAKEDITEGTTAIVSLRGGMIRYANYWYQSAELVISQLDYLNNNDNIESIVLEIDGFGGQASAIPMFIDFASRKRKPIVSVIHSAYSLHYWIACALTDPGKMYMSNNITAGVGSVGAMTSFARFSEYFKKLGIEFFDVYPDESKHKNEISRLIEEDPDKAVKKLKEELKPLAIAFQDAVKTARPNIKDATGVLTGGVFRAKDALKYNMADGVYTLQQAIALQDLEF